VSQTWKGTEAKGMSLRRRRLGKVSRRDGEPEYKLS